MIFAKLLYWLLVAFLVLGGGAFLGFLFMAWNAWCDRRAAERRRRLGLVFDPIRRLRR